MNPESDKQLVEKYPLIFVDRFGNMQDTAMCWGFECSQGWFNILDQMCSAIQSHIDNNIANAKRAEDYNQMLLNCKNQNWDEFNKISKNWNVALKERRIAEILTESPRIVPEISQVVATQVKEKYGTLRFYFNGGDPYIDGIVHMAENMSAVTCEECGNPGTMNDGSWYRVLCDYHKNGTKTWNATTQQYEFIPNAD